MIRPKAMVRPKAKLWPKRPFGFAIAIAAFKGLNAMTALSRFLVLLALFLSGSHANVFTSLSSVARNQVLVNYLIQLQQPMSDPTNEPIRKPTKRMDLNAELSTNLSQKKSQVAYSEPKQDAELPSKITDLTNTQMHGLCHEKIRSRIICG